MNLLSNWRTGLRLALLSCLAWISAPSFAQRLDDTPRVAVISAFGAELSLLKAQLQGARTLSANGVDFSLGQLRGRDVVLLESGISMVNAAMTTQLVLDRFRVSHLIVSGIAGGVNPQLRIGDVTVAQRWSQYLEVLVAREVQPGRFQAPEWMKDVGTPNFGIWHPRPVRVRSESNPKGEDKQWFEVDATLLRVAEGLGDGRLQRCPPGAAPGNARCLGHTPKLVVGGNGVSGQAFVDNAAFREYTHKTFSAQVLDMETAAIGHVAHANAVPWIAFRSLSDLAGGGQDENEIGKFFQLAADNAAAVLLQFLEAWK